MPQTAFLLPFDDILNVFMEQMSSEYNLEKLSRLQQEAENMVSGTITISKIELGMVRLSLKDQPGKYRMVPAWKFYGSAKVQYKDHVTDTAERGERGGTNYKTINSMDGSIIEIGIGY